MALSDRREATRLTGPVFFDRGLIDAAAALEYAAGKPAASEICREHRYHRRAFLVPPWPEIYHSDAARKHGLADAMAEYERLLTTYRQLGYEVVIIPKMAVADRADFVIGHFRPASLPHPEI
jgi:predicted ATPase